MSETREETYEEREEREKQEKIDAANKAALTATDWRGTPLRVGSRVLYPISVSHVTEVVQGVVIEFLPATGYWGPRVKGAPYRLKIQPEFEVGDLFKELKNPGDDHHWWRRDKKFLRWEEDENGNKTRVYEDVTPRATIIQRVDTVTVVPW